MKRLTAILLLVIIVLNLSACKAEHEPICPVSYHYLRAPLSDGEILHGSADSVIAPEIREGDGYQNDVSHLIEIYLLGPLDRNYRSPFPVGTALKSITVDGAHASVVLSRHFANHNGIDLSLACACLTITVMELTGVESVTISVDGFQLDGKTSITMDRSNMILTDSATPEIQ